MWYSELTTRLDDVVYAVEQAEAVKEMNVDEVNIYPNGVLTVCRSLKLDRTGPYRTIKHNETLLPPASNFLVPI